MGKRRKLCVFHSAEILHGHWWRRPGWREVSRILIFLLAAYPQIGQAELPTGGGTVHRSPRFGRGWGAFD
ncbi:hypothetical protein TNCV_4858271 [Trichonephila clavipes]|nr:hypothetical protein TNCV_4858271 [Trichonephila clavipes]